MKRKKQNQIERKSAFCLKQANATALSRVLRHDGGLFNLIVSATQKYVCIARSH